MASERRKRAWCKTRRLFVLVTGLVWIFSANVLVVLMVLSDLVEDNTRSFRRRLEPRFQDAVHVVTTRFMQHQPTLLALGRARLELFKTMCLSTMLHQDTSDFLWLILVDPELHTELLEELKTLLAPQAHFFLIQSTEASVDLSTLDRSLVLSGNADLLNLAQSAMSDKVFLETKLDADDGLASDLLHRLQDLAVGRLSTSSTGWATYCIHRHFEWHPTTLNSTHPFGLLILVDKGHCVVPGLTFAFAPGVTERPRVLASHHQILERVVKPCQEAWDTNCLYRLQEIKGPVAVRARTPTSAGMADILREYDETKASVPLFWLYLQRAFGIPKEALQHTKGYLERHICDIARDNLQGQCTKGHSCKRESKQLLQHLLSAHSTIPAKHPS